MAEIHYLILLSIEEYFILYGVMLLNYRPFHYSISAIKLFEEQIMYRYFSFPLLAFHSQSDLGTRACRLRVVD